MPSIEHQFLQHAHCAMPNTRVRYMQRRAEQGMSFSFRLSGSPLGAELARAAFRLASIHVLVCSRKLEGIECLGWACLHANSLG